MVDKIYQAKAKVLERIDRSIAERGTDRMDIQEMGMLADIVKDLSEAEKACWEAEYYKSISQAMASGAGYTPMSSGRVQPAMGYDAGRMAAGGYMPDGPSGYRDAMGRYATRPGYDAGRHGYDMQGLRDAMASAPAEERAQLERELRQMLGM